LLGTTGWSVECLDHVFGMASWNVTYDKKRNSKVEWKNDFTSTKWIVINGIESARCKVLYILNYFVLRKNFEVACVICGAQAQ